MTRVDSVDVDRRIEGEDVLYGAAALLGEVDHPLVGLEANHFCAREPRLVGFGAHL